MNNSLAGSVHVHEPEWSENLFPKAIRYLRRVFRQFRPIPMLAGAIVLVTPFATSAQNNPVLPRVTDRVDAARLVTLSGNTHPLARAQYDQGAAPPNLPMDRIMLVLKRNPDQEAALQDLLVHVGDER